MGYKAKIKNITIRFAEDHEFHGAEAVARGMSFGEWEEATSVEESGTAAVKRFVDHLVSWNLEDPDTGEPLPPTMDSVRKIDNDLASALNNAWVQSLIGVHDADPLPESSTSGEPSLVESVPMEALSPSLAS